MTLITTVAHVFENAETFADAVHDGELDNSEATKLVSAGRVYLPFRYGDMLAFAPAKFIGYHSNDIETYRENVYDRNGGRARAAVSKALGFDAEENEALELQLANYCSLIGVDLHDHRHSFWLTRTARKSARSDRSAINDLDSSFIGNDDPEYRKRMAGSYFRDDRVRKKVLERAAGRCEYCGELGFENQKGHPFLECHHVISLSEEGPDKLSNVIALCPNHHREAHFGGRWKSLQDEFKKIVLSKHQGTR